MRTKEASQSKQMLINICGQVLSFAVNIGIGFFLTPYIIRTVGGTAYGFVGLANNFVNYVQILTTALNSMAGRFIAISYYRNEEENVKRYFSSVFIANIVIAVVLLVPSVAVILYIDKIVNVPWEILGDVRTLWAFIFGSMLLSITFTIFNNAAYVRNRLELVSLRTVESNLLKAIILIGLFALFQPKVWYVGLASMVCVTYVACINIYYTKKLLPIAEVKRKYFDLAKIRELISAGIWNSVGQLGNILSTGLDLLITNLFVGAEPMGIVSISKVIPTYVQSLFITVSSAFAPQLTISYAGDDKEGMKQQLGLSMKIMGMFANVPIAFILAYGTEFYQLWTPTQDARVLMFLTIAAVIEYPVSLVMYPIQNVFGTYNKVKVSSIATIILSVSSFLTVMLLVGLREDILYKMIVVVGVSCLYNIIRNGLFIPQYCARLMGISSLFFYGILFKNIISTAALSFLAIGLHKIFAARSWITLIIAGGIVGFTGLAINYMLLLTKEEQRQLLNRIKKLVIRK